MATMTEERTQQAAEFAVGDGATYTLWTDAKAGTIIEATATKVTWQADKATLLNPVGSDEPDALHFEPGGFVGHTSGRQRYEYERDTEGATAVFTKRKNGQWKRTGQPMRSPGGTLRAGRNHYRDFNF